MRNNSGLSSLTLTLLEEANNKGELTIVLHVFSGERKIGKVILSGGQVVQSDPLVLEMSKPLQSYVNDRSIEVSTSRVFEFSLNHQESVIQVIGELLEPPPQLLIFGAGHVGQAVAAIGALAGYNVIVVDDRAEFLTRERFPDTSIRLIGETYDKVKSHIRISNNTVVVIVTRGHQHDETCLEQVIDAGARYIGMIGSRRRVLSIFNRLTVAGIKQAALDRVHAPIGLKIGAVTPQEIAVAILAEIISVMSGHKSDHASERRT